MKILLLDIETAPHKVYSWGLWQQNIAINQIEEPGYTLCWAAKWLDEKKVHYVSILDGKGPMLQGIHELVSEADVVVHYNGDNFDMPTLSQEWLIEGFSPPAPYISLDLLRAVKSRFRFPSNKLSYVAEQLDLGEKVHHKGMELWRECMAGDKAAWKTMKEYNKQDVALLERLYVRMKPWIKNHPNHAIFSNDEDHICPNCGGKHLQRRGSYYTKTQKYTRWACQDCGSWSRSKQTELTKDKRASVLVGV